MGFKDLLKGKLGNELKEKSELLPSGFQALGEIAIINLNSDLLKHKHEIGKTFLELFPRFKAVYNKEGEIIGEFRIPQVKLIAGNKSKKEAEVIENGIRYRFNVTKLMFAKGNINERLRIAREVKKGEIVVDMFSGIGYFSVPVGKLSKAEKIYSIEKNPEGFYYLNENIRLNNIKNIESINGDNRKVIENLVERGVKAARIIMGYLPPPKDFLSSAFKIAKKGTVIHYEDLLLDERAEKEAEERVKEIIRIAEKYEFSVKLKKLVRVKNYRPRVGHYVLDLEVV
jgi:tRNA wybutosine-synthesizing protein 2